MTISAVARSRAAMVFRALKLALCPPPSHPAYAPSKPRELINAALEQLSQLEIVPMQGQDFPGS
jgi:hypothetical protein